MTGQTFSDLRSSYIPDVPAQVEIEYTYGQLPRIYVSICKGMQLNANTNTLEREGSQYERPIAQQYSSAHIRLIALNFRKEIAGTRLNFFVFLFFYFLKIS
jgi:hypothetical protein